MLDANNHKIEKGIIAHDNGDIDRDFLISFPGLFSSHADTLEYQTRQRRGSSAIAPTTPPDRVHHEAVYVFDDHFSPESTASAPLMAYSG